jgi:glycosyltransferase involved in cell wall biosynthesis
VISLVTTVLNREKYLGLAVDSILTQTYHDWELIIWDDGSTDSSPNIAQKYAEYDSRIRHIPAAHTGRAKALREAIAISSGEYLGFVDSDDLLDPNALAETVRFLDTHPEIGMVYTDHSIFDEFGVVLGLGARCHIPYSPDRLLVDFMTFHFRLLRREIYDRVGGIDVDFPQAQDYDLCLKISEVTQIYHHREPLYYYRKHPGTISVCQKANQTERSATAVRNALVRRGLSGIKQLIVTEDSKFKLISK